MRILARKTLRARRFFQPYISFFLHYLCLPLKRLAVSQKPLLLKRKTFAPQHPDQYRSYEATSEQSPVKMRWQEDQPSSWRDAAVGYPSRDSQQTHAATRMR